MNVIVCVDDDGGMLFNRRRQSRDRMLIEDVLAMTEENGSRLWIAPFSEELLAPLGAMCSFITVDDEFLNKALPQDFCFVENVSLKEYEEMIDSITVYRWNRKYPADTFFDIDLTSWQKRGEKEFAGSSHERITREVYRK